MGSTDVTEEWRESDRARRRKPDGQENKFYNFLNRSASSITRSASRSRRVKDKDKDKESTPPDSSRDGSQASHATSSRLPVTVASASTSIHDERAQTGLKYGSSRSAKTHRTIASLDTTTARTEPRHSLSPPVSPRTQHTGTQQQRAYAYNTPPQTPSSSRDPSASFPSSPAMARGSSGTDLLLHRSISRPNTPSGSSTGLKVFGLLLPSPKFKRVAIEPDSETVTDRRSGHKPRTGSGSSNEPLLNGGTPPKGKLSTEFSLEQQQQHQHHHNYQQQQQLQQHVNGSSRLATSTTSAAGGLPSPTTPARVLHKDPPRSLSPRKSISTPTPARTAVATTATTPRPPLDSKGKQRAFSPEPKSNKNSNKNSRSGDQEATLHKPQARAPVSFLPSVLPRLQRTPPTPERGLAVSTSPRVDSFMSDSVPVVPTVPQALLSPATPTASVGRQHAFAQSISTRKETLKTPQPEVKAKEEKPVAPGLGIARSRSAPGSARGRMSPCLRIPSPKFLSRDRSKSKEHDSEKGADSGTEREKSERYGLGWGREKVRKVTPESVGAPILRDAHAHAHVRAPGAASSHGHGHAHAHTHTNGIDHSKAQKSPGLAPPPRSPVTKPSLQYIRRGAHGSFDFERPGSRTSSKSGQSGTDDEKDVSGSGHGNGSGRTRLLGGVTTTTTTTATMAVKANGVLDAPPNSLETMQARHRLKHKASSPPPPLPRLKQKSPPPVRPRARSPLAPTPGLTTQTNSIATHEDFDDSALPRLSSSITRRGNGVGAEYNHHNGGRTHRTQASLPAFSFEPASASAASTSASSRPTREKSGRGAGAMYVDPHTGLTWAPTPLKENAIAEEGVVPGGARRSVSVKRPSTAAGNREAGVKSVNRISPRELEAATAVITQFKSALDDIGFVTLQKYIRRYDAQIMPLEGAAGLLVRVQRLLETNAPRVNEKRKCQLLDSFVHVVGQTS